MQVRGWAFTLLATALGAFVVGCQSATPTFSSRPDIQPEPIILDPHRGLDGPTICEFPLQVGDGLLIYWPVTGEVSGIYVAGDGTVTLPEVGTFVAAGKLPSVLRAEIGRGDPLLQQMGMVPIGEPFFYVFGEVNAPGPKVWLPGTTVVKAVQSAGGVTKRASSRRIKLVHRDGRVELVRFDKATDPYDPPVLPNERIIVSRKSWFGK